MKRMLWAVLLASTVGVSAISAQTAEELESEYKAADADNDGKLTVKEWVDANTEEDTPYNEKWGQYVVYFTADADSDDVVTLAEFKALGANIAKGGKYGKITLKGIEKITNQTFADVDTDKDGKLSQKEVHAAFGENSPITEYDKDESGDIDKEEFDGVLRGLLKDNFDFEDKKAKDESKETGVKEGETKTGDTDAFALYKKQGRTWTWKSTSKMAGTENVAYMKYEVIKVADDHAMVKMTMLDKDKKPNEYVKPQEQKIEFKTAEGGEAEGEAPEVETTDETVKVEAGEFECTKTEMESNGTKTTSWMSKKYPGLLVKATSKTDSYESTMELVEFKDGE